MSEEYTAGTREGRMELMATVAQDLRYAIRQIRRRPTFALATVLVLALGIGANTAVFSVVDGVLLQTVPLPHADRLVRVSPVVPNFGIGGANLPGFQDWDREKGPFEALGGFHTTVHSLTTDGRPERIMVGSTIGDLFGAAGLTASIGRTYPPTEPGAASEPVLLLTDGFWRSSFGGDRGVVGRTVEMDGRSVRILGVLPPEEEFLRFGREIDAWAPMDEPLPWMGRGTGFLTVLGRLQPHLSSETAQEPLLALANGLDSAPEKAIAETIRQVDEITSRRGITEPTKMTAAFSDGERVFAVRYSSDESAPSLYLNCSDGSALVASEPLDGIADRWVPIAPAGMVVVEGPDKCKVRRIDFGSTTPARTSP